MFISVEYFSSAVKRFYLSLHRRVYGVVGSGESDFNSQRNQHAAQQLIDNALRLC